MEALNLKAGSNEWLQARKNYYTASEAPAMMGVSKHKTRDQLLFEKKTGEIPPVSEFEQRIFDKGHETEKNQKTIIEQEIQKELFPVTGVLAIGGLKMLASFDGISIDNSVTFEHKQWNQDKAEKLNREGFNNIEDNDFRLEYIIQMEQQLMISRAEKCIFVMSDGTKDKRIILDYFPDKEMHKKIIQGWKIFDDDLKNYKPKITESVTPNEVRELPLVDYKVEGSSITSNLVDYNQSIELLILESKKELITDQDFSDRNLLVKKLREGNKKLKDVKIRMQSEFSDLDKISRQIDEAHEHIRRFCLASEKLIKSENLRLRSDLNDKMNHEISKHIDSLNDTIRPVKIRHESFDFFSCMKGKRLIDAMNNACHKKLIDLKIKASDDHLLITKCLKLINLNNQYRFLFNDLQSLIDSSSDYDHFVLLVEKRITDYEHLQQEKERKEKELEERKKQETWDKLIEQQEKEKAKEMEESKKEIEHPNQKNITEEKEIVESRITSKEEQIKYNNKEKTNDKFMHFFEVPTNFTLAESITRNVRTEKNSDLLIDNMVDFCRNYLDKDIMSIDSKLNNTFDRDDRCDCSEQNNIGMEDGYLQGLLFAIKQPEKVKTEITIIYNSLKESIANEKKSC